MLYLITYILNVFDAIATHIWVERYGISVEANPIGRWLIENNIMWGVKIAYVGLGLLFLYNKRELIFTRVLIWVLFVEYFAIALYHIYLFCVRW